MSTTTPSSELVTLSDAYDFHDFGCSTGANIAYTNEVLPSLRGLGIDIAPPKVAAARESGHDAIVFDILELRERKQVSFVTMSHFLEHLPSLVVARSMIAKAISVSKDFVMIRQPWFDADGELLRRGFKFYWSHWSGHRNKMTTLDFYAILSEALHAGRIQRFSMYGRSPVSGSDHVSIIPLSAPRNQHQYDVGTHGPKALEQFDFAAYKEIVVRVDIGEAGQADALQSRMSPLYEVFDSDGLRVA